MPTPEFQRVALVGKYHANAPTRGTDAGTTSAHVLSAIGEFLHSRGCEVLVETATATHTGLDRRFANMDMEALGQHSDLCIVVGGDGTTLGVGRELAPHGTPLVGINQGRLGFVTDIPLHGWREALDPMLHGEYVRDRRPLMHAQVLRDGQCVFEALAMNDVVVNRGGTAGMLEVRVEVNGQFVSNQRADGLIVSTPTGSTAYALSVGGPLMHPDTPAWVMAPIAPHTLSNRPIVLPDSCNIMMTVVGGRDVSANFDMQSLASVMLGDCIHVRRAGFDVHFLHPVGWNYFATLRRKLGWNEGGQ